MLKRTNAGLWLVALTSLLSNVLPQVALAEDPASNCGNMAGYQVGAAWPAFKGCATRIGQAKVYGPAQYDPSSAKTWSRSLGQDAGSVTIAADGTIYLNSGTFLYAYTALGALKWKVNVVGKAASGQAIAADGTIYLTAGNQLVAVNPSGTIKWTYTGSAGATMTSAPLIGPDGSVYVGEDISLLVGNVFAVRANGTLKWKVASDAVASTFMMSADGSAVYVGTKTNGLRALRAADGGTIWAHGLALGATGTGAVGSDGVIYVGGAAGIMLALNPSDGSERWQFNQGAPMANSPVIGPDGTLYTTTIGIPGTVNGKLFAVTKAGVQKWSLDLKGLTGASPIVDAGGTIYIGTLNGLFQAISSNGARLWSYQTGDAIYASAAFAADGTLLIGSNDDKLYSFGGGRPAGLCGSATACTVAGSTNADTYVRASQPAASFGTTTPLIVGYNSQENRALVRFSLDDVVATVHKRAELLSAKLVLSRTAAGTGSGSGVLTANVMTRTWTSSGASWTCANDTNTSATASTCAASDVWSMTGSTLPFTTTNAATASVTFSATTDIELNVTSAFAQAISNDVADISWVLRMTTGTGALNLGSQESGSAARLVLTFGPDTRATQRRNDVLAEIAAAITNPRQEGRANWAAWAAACELRRAVDGVSTHPKFVAYAATLNALDRDAVRKIANDIKDIPAATATKLLGPFSGIDPRACLQEPLFATAGAINKNNDPNLFGRLRAPYCRSNDDSITVGSEVVQAPEPVADAPGNVPGSGRVASKARPVITGVDPTLYLPTVTDSSVTAMSELGDPVLVNDWIANRGGTNGPSNPLFPGDGLSPFGVPTSASCASGTTYANDTCDHTKGLICGNLVGHAQFMKCIAFPIIPREENIRLRGTNFWDPTATLKFQSLEHSALVNLQNPTPTGVNANESTAQASCTPAQIVSGRPSLFSLGNISHNTLEFPVTVANGFYRLKLYNANGQFKTHADTLTGRSAGREIHVCRNEANPEDYDEGTDGTNHDCTPPTSACSADGALCPAGTWRTPPRPLSECRSTTLEVGERDKCGETPMFFASEGPEVFVYVENQRPTFTHRAFLNRMECAEETGCDHCGGEDEFGLIYFSVTKTVLNNMAKGDPRELASAMGVYRANFNEGQIRHPEAKVQELSNVKRSDQVFTYFKYYEDDKETVTRTAVIGGIVGLGFATLGVLYESGGAAVAAAATALATERIIAATKGADNLGTREWVTDYWGMSDRISFTHQANFLRDHIANPAASLSVLPKDLPAMSSGDFIPTLLHPIVGYGGAISSVAVECGASGLSCSSGTTCYVNQCIGTSERVGAAANLSWPSGFSSGVTDDPTWNVGYRGRMDLTKGGGRYKGDFEFVICPENDPSSDFTSKQERCQGVD